MQGNEVFKVAVRSLTEVSIEALQTHGFTHEDAKLFIPHQANRRILEATAKRLHLKTEQTYINVHNMVHWELPFPLRWMRQIGRVSPGDSDLVGCLWGGLPGHRLCCAGPDF